MSHKTALSRASIYRYVARRFLSGTASHWSWPDSVVGARGAVLDAELASSWPAFVRITAPARLRSHRAGHHRVRKDRRQKKCPGGRASQSAESLCGRHRAGMLGPANELVSRLNSVGLQLLRGSIASSTSAGLFGRHLSGSTDVCADGRQFGHGSFFQSCFLRQHCRVRCLRRRAQAIAMPSVFALTGAAFGAALGSRLFHWCC